VFAFLAGPVGHLLAFLHSALSTVLLPGSGPAWALSIVLLTVLVRLLLLPLFVKQAHSQRRMQQIAPEVKALQKQHKGDRETLNRELMALFKARGANPAAGCLPVLVQLPVMFALFRVIREFRPGAAPAYGLSAQMLSEGGRAKLFGAPLSAGFSSPLELLTELDGRQTTVRLVALGMVVLMGLSTTWTQRQTMARAGASDPQQVLVRKLMLYGLPLSFAVSGMLVPIGVLLYWLTTNVWSMGQQSWVFRRMLAAVPSPSGGEASSRPAPAPPAGVVTTVRRPSAPSEPGRSSARGSAGGRRRKKRKGGRR